MSQADGVLGSQVLAAVDAADDLLAAAAGGAVWQCSEDEIEATLDGLDHLDARSAALRATLLTQAEQRSLRQRTGAPSTERWLADRFRWSRARAARGLRQAQRLVGEPALHAALAAGAVTTEQADTISAGLDQLDRVPGVTAAERAQAATVLVAEAATLDPRGLATTATAIAANLSRLPSVDDPAEAAALARELARAERDAQQRETNRFRLGRRNGRTRAVIDFGVLGEAVAHEWARILGKPTPGADGFDDARDTAERLGDEIVDLMAAHAAGTGEACCSEPHEENTHGDSGHGAADPLEAGLFDGLDPTDQSRDPDEIEQCEAGAQVQDGSDVETGSGQQPCCRHRGPISPMALLTVTVTLAELRAGLTDAGRLDTGQTVSAATMRRLACDAMVIPAVLNGRSEVLDLGRTRRLYSLSQRRATIVHQKACAAPGCDRPPQACQVHHDWDWEHGGPTDLRSGTLLCGYHHRMVHRQGWTVRRAANGYPEFVPPATIDPLQRPRQHVRYQLLANGRLRA